MWSATYHTSCSYGLAGQALTQTYPSGHVVTYRYDAAGRLADNQGQPAFSGNLGDGAQRTYSTGITYDAGSRLNREQFGTTTPTYHKRHYNTRGQLFDVRVGAAPDKWSWNRGALIMYYDSAYSWLSGTTAPTVNDNNGNVTKMQTWIPGDDPVSTWSLTEDVYAYDSLNRLTSGTEFKQSSAQGSAQEFV